ncbi:hypothetical protein cyc_07292 [Cyclospora cayetanensis]|uniref:N(6)-L-threonylcarbamoyladenine synthase n=1 Tax=Cyclospora cayetanensis TaxID=88456 RepID=A0A1D3CW26_9EIME|nr:hypothetical protein cyc_07292 [Cyclospora cayetanensis]
MSTALFFRGVSDADTLSLSCFAFTEGPGLALCLRAAAEAAVCFFQSLRELLLLSRAEKRSLDDLLAAAYTEILGELQGGPAAEHPSLMHPPEAAFSGSRDRLIRIDASWHLRCAVRRLLRGAPKACLRGCRLEQQQQQRAAVEVAVKARLAAAAARRMPCLIGVHHLHGHALSASLPGASVFPLVPPSGAPPFDGETSASSRGGSSGTLEESPPPPCGGESPTERLEEAAAVAAATETPQAAEADSGAGRSSKASSSDVSPLDPMLCLLLSGGHSQFSLLVKAEALSGEGFRAAQFGGERRRSLGGGRRSPSKAPSGETLSLSPPGTRGSAARTPREASAQSQCHFSLQPQLEVFPPKEGPPGGPQAPEAPVPVGAPLPLRLVTLGRSLDDALGEALDKTARLLQNLSTAPQHAPREQHHPHPHQAGGAYLEELAAAADEEGWQARKIPSSHAARTLDMRLVATKAVSTPSSAVYVCAPVIKGLFEPVGVRLSQALWLAEFIPEIRTVALAGGVARNKALQRLVLERLHQRGDLRLQQREFAALKKRLIRLVERRPISLVKAPGLENGSPLPTGGADTFISSEKQHLKDQEQEDSVKALIRERVRRFPFESFLGFRVRLSSFVSLCCNLPPESHAFDAKVPLLVPRELLSRRASDSAWLRAKAARAAAEEGRLEEAGFPSTCQQCTLVMPRGTQEVSSVPSGRDFVSRNSHPLQCVSVMWCYCGACGNSGRQSAVRGVERLVVPAASLCSDNAAMIGWTALQYREIHREAPLGEPPHQGQQRAEPTGACVGVGESRAGVTEEAHEASDTRNREGPPGCFEVPFVKPKWDGGGPLPHPLAAMDLLLLHALLQQGVSSHS